MGYLRRKHRRLDPELLAGALIELVPSTPSSLVFACHKVYILVQALRTLPLEDQILLEAKFFEDLTEFELAEILEIKTTTVPGRLLRARTQLLRAVQRELAKGGEAARAEEVALLLETWISELRHHMRRGAPDALP